jgi:hypothetical protein
MRVRAAVHVHSTCSFDGHWPLERLVCSLRRRGYRAVLTAEHSQSLDAEQWRRYQEECARLSGPQFLVLPGLEYRDTDNVVHIPTWGEDMPHLGDHVDIDRLLRTVAQHEGVSVLAHPDRRDAWTRVHEDWVGLLSGVEVWNRKYDGWRPGSAGRALARDHALPTFGSLDFHRRRQFAPVATRIDVDGPLGAAALLAALRAGRAEAEFLGRPVSTWTRGAPGTALAAADTSRRLAASTVRRLRP